MGDEYPKVVTHKGISYVCDDAAEEAALLQGRAIIDVVKSAQGDQYSVRVAVEAPNPKEVK